MQLIYDKTNFIIAATVIIIRKQCGYYYYYYYWLTALGQINKQINK